jgi:hypothetical protein
MVCRPMTIQWQCFFAEQGFKALFSGCRREILARVQAVPADRWVLRIVVPDADMYLRLHQGEATGRNWCPPDRWLEARKGTEISS